MPIRQFVGRDVSFGSDDLKAMDKAFSGALVQLGLRDRKDAMVELVARRICARYSMGSAIRSGCVTLQ